MTTVSSFSLTCEGGPLFPVHTRFAPNSGLSRRVDKRWARSAWSHPFPPLRPRATTRPCRLHDFFFRRRKKRPHTPESFLFLYAGDKGFLRFANRDGR
ncbi:hypothetical protein CDAR_93031 [Caerostris darwini]|uniref:Uncharacterized protein n=1 Tax=Caerostris darwini TaxID=1538125 RepID=A0AAV4WGA6_9ARAC|nr:hypothetical protein CDAR_93031 [Caerostris darwini]